MAYATFESGPSFVQLVNHTECVEKYKPHSPFPGMESPPSLVSTHEICVKKKDDEGMAGPCHSVYGLPLVASVKGRGLQLLGLANDDFMCDADMPAVFSRVSSYLQWIRASIASDTMWSKKPSLTLELNISQIFVPDGFQLKIYTTPHECGGDCLAGWEAGKEPKDMDALAILDSKCQASKEEPFTAVSSLGSMLIMLVPPDPADVGDVNQAAQNCGAECLEKMGFTAKFGLGEGQCIGKASECPATANCSMSVTWSEFGPKFEDKGKGYTGGLGKRMVKRHDREYGVWACLRDWNPEEQISCGAQIGELACFWFEEKSRRFEFQGLNSKTRLVTPAQDKHGKGVEDRALRGRTLATSPDQDHA